MIEQIINLAEIIESDLKKIEAGDFDVTLTSYTARCAEFVEEFNALDFEERLEFLTNNKNCWDVDRLTLSMHAICHSNYVSDPQPTISESDRTVDHLMIDSEPATIVTTINGEGLSFDNFPEFRKIYFTNYFPLTDEAAIAACHIAVLCPTLGGIR